MPSLHRVFDSYAAAALSITAHGALAVLVLWSGARLFNSTSAMAETRPVIDWVPLPGINSPERTAAPAARRTALRSGVDRLKGASVRIPLGPPHPALHVPPPVPVTIDEPVSNDEPVSSDLGNGSCGEPREVSTSLDAEDRATEPTPPDDERAHDVQFWVRADGRVARIAVSPPIRDAGFRRQFMKAMRTFVFGPVQTPDGRSIDYIYRCVVYP